MSVQVRVLGPVGVSVADVDVVLPPGRPLWVLAALALGGGPVSTGQLIGALWGQNPPVTAANALQVHVSHLRSALRRHGLGVTLTAAGYRLDLDAAVVDATQFARLDAAGRAATEQGRPDQAVANFTRALDLFTGPVLANVQEAPFAADATDQLERRRADVRRARLEAGLELGLGPSLLDEAAAVAAADPYDERACALLMKTLYRAGQPATALARYQQFREQLSDDLGLEPGPALVEVERQVLNHDLGVQVPSAADRTRHNIPAELSTFIGRAAELVQLRQRLTESRLLTLCGAGGSGKTRLALRFAREVIDSFADGVLVVELAPVTSPERVTGAIVSIVGSRPSDGLKGLIDAIGTRTELLVLDNCEHVIDSVADVAYSLLRSCPNLRVITTSREPLSIDGEFVFRVPPLTHADDGTGDAVTLFLDRAAQQHLSKPVSAQNRMAAAAISARLDGLPLAIELTAARLRTMSLEDLSRSLDDGGVLLVASSTRGVVNRQQTLHNLIDWSYQLLDDNEKQLLDQLSVFAGGFTLHAATGVAVETRNAARTLVALTDKSLVEVDPVKGRYRLLETIRVFADEKLRDRPIVVQRDTRLSHARYFAAIAQAASVAIALGPGQDEALNQLDDERDNLRRALQTLTDDTSDVDAAMRFVNALGLYWHMRGLYREGITASQQVLQRAAGSNSSDFVLLLCTISDLLDGLGEAADGLRHAERATALADTLGRQDLKAESAVREVFALTRMGRFQEASDRIAATRAGHHAGLLHTQINFARAYLMVSMSDDALAAVGVTEEILDMAEAAGNVRHIGMALLNLSSLNISLGQYDKARSQLSRVIELAIRVRDTSNMLYGTLNLGLIALCEQDPLTAWTHYRETLLTAKRIVSANNAPIVCALLGVSLCRQEQGDPEAAAILLGFADEEQANGRVAFDITERRLRTDALARLQATLGPEVFGRLTRRGAALDVQRAVDMALKLGPVSA